MSNRDFNAVKTNYQSSILLKILQFHSRKSTLGSIDKMRNGLMNFLGGR